MKDVTGVELLTVTVAAVADPINAVPDTHTTFETMFDRNFRGRSDIPADNPNPRPGGARRNPMVFRLQQRETPESGLPVQRRYANQAPPAQGIRRRRPARRFRRRHWHRRRPTAAPGNTSPVEADLHVDPQADSSGDSSLSAPCEPARGRAPRLQRVLADRSGRCAAQGPGQRWRGFVCAGSLPTMVAQCGPKPVRQPAPAGAVPSNRATFVHLSPPPSCSRDSPNAAHTQSATKIATIGCRKEFL